jgi:hypothetical protein
LACVALQAEHTTPPVPQLARVFPVTQLLPLQQPVQVAGSQTHTPPWHF